MSKVQEIQGILDVEADGLWGPKTQAALELLLHPAPQPSARRRAQASSFADDADIAAFYRCKRNKGYMSRGTWHAGSSDKHCFNVGDNAVGFWEDATRAGTGPACAITALEIKARWGSLDEGRHKLVRVFYQGRQAEIPVKDLLGTGGRVDLNPDALELLGLKAPTLVDIEWEWV